MIVKDINMYDGNLLHNRFAYSFYRSRVLPIGNIVAFRAPMKVELDGMIDQEDVLKNEFIYSEDAINFLWEIPNLNAFGAIAYQRLFNTSLANVLQKYINKPIEVDGDDLIVHAEHNQGGIIQPKGKCSVSITHVKDDAALGHTGINIRAGKDAPSFAFSTHLSDEEADSFMEDVTRMFYTMNDDIFVATTKIISK
tara:strand:- start:86 stop:673 length:588 start_codon:yes stop_codon:yes gene_type:complete